MGRTLKEALELLDELDRAGDEDADAARREAAREEAMKLLLARHLAGLGRRGVVRGLDGGEGPYYTQ